ncbi:MAG: RimK-like ATP-grasp protein [Mucilaginibacter sp.]|nr:RimK-like ATP-grasp protein [Mucilaginibacter sp.]
MILLLTDTNDSHADHIVKLLQASTIPYYRMNLDKTSLQATSCIYDGLDFKLIQNEKCLNASDVQCVWNRKSFAALSPLDTDDELPDAKLWRHEWNRLLSGLYDHLKDLPWLNFWRLSLIAGNKYLQMRAASVLGFNLPEFIVSNDQAVLKEFALRHPAVVLKLMHQDFYKIPEMPPQVLFVNKITNADLERFGGLEENPIVLQQYIEKSYEVRYTVVGSRHFACKIDSQASAIANTDWRRYDVPHTPHLPIEPPPEIRHKVDELMKTLELHYGALDFIVDPQGDWYFLEINPDGQYLWIEELTGLPISSAIVEWFTDKLQNKNQYESICN